MFCALGIRVHPKVPPQPLSLGQDLCLHGPCSHSSRAVLQTCPCVYPLESACSLSRAVLQTCNFVCPYPTYGALKQVPPARDLPTWALELHSHGLCVPSGSESSRKSMPGAAWQRVVGGNAVAQYQEGTILCEPALCTLIRPLRTGMAAVSQRLCVPACEYVSSEGQKCLQDERFCDRPLGSSLGKASRVLGAAPCHTPDDSSLLLRVSSSSRVVLALTGDSSEPPSKPAFLISFPRQGNKPICQCQVYHGCRLPGPGLVLCSDPHLGRVSKEKVFLPEEQM